MSSSKIGGTDKQPTLHWHVDAALRRQLEKTRLGRRVLCTDHHQWSTGRIVQASAGKWNVEELFRRAKKGGVVPWGPSHQWADGSLRLRTFATVLGLMLVSLAKIALGTGESALAMMGDLAEIRATLVRATTGGPGRRATVLNPAAGGSPLRLVQAFDGVNALVYRRIAGIVRRRKDTNPQIRGGTDFWSLATKQPADSLPATSRDRFAR
jgi:hypothetical protein